MTSPRPDRLDRRAAFAAGALVFALCLAASPPRFLRSSDGRAMFATAEALAVRGELSIDPLYLDDDIPVNPSAKAGPDGRAYAKYGVGWPALLAVLLRASASAGLSPSSDAVQLAALALNPALAALTAVLVTALASALGATRRWAVTLGVASVVSTFAWHNAVSDGADMLMALLVTQSLWHVVRFRQGGRIADATLAGAAMGAALLVKSALVVLAPPIVLALVAVRRVGAPRWSPRHALAPAVACCVAMGAGIALVLWLNHARWGSPFASGYNEPVLTGEAGVGLWHLTLGVNKGLAWYAPPAFAGLIALASRARRAPGLALAAGLGALALLLLTAKFYEFGGGWTWGPRYLLPVVPALTAAAALWLDARAGRALAGVLVALGLVVSSLGASVDPSASRATFASAWLPEASGLVRSGDTHRPGVLVEQPRPVEDVLPEFSGLAVNAWIVRVLLAPCACGPDAAGCPCAAGGDMYWHPRFRAAPWVGRYPQVDPRPPYGEDLLAPAVLRRLYRRLVLDPAAAPDPRGAGRHRP